MRVAAALALLLAASASAQTVDPHERIYGPFKPGPASRAPAVAIASHGMLMVWSEVDPGSRVATIHTALLDFDGKLAGPIHTLAPTRASVHATNPAVSTDGNNFFVAWLERDRFGNGGGDVAGVLVGRNGAALRGTESFGGAVDGAPSLIWTGVDYRLFGTGHHSIAPDCTVTIASFGVAPQRVQFATPSANGWIDWSGERTTNCFVFCGGRPPVTLAHLLDYAVITRDWIRSGRIRETGYLPNGPPAVEAMGDDLLLVWGTPQGLKAQRIIDGEPAQTFTLDDVRARDAVPSMTGSLVVFEHGYDIYGAVIHGDSFGEIFPISAGAPFDSEPRVHRLGEHRYLITYVRDNAHLVTRFVETK